jgi:4'-phosphopantetheinyl transferase
MIYLNDDIAHFDFEASLPLLSSQRREQALKFKHEQGRRTSAAAYLLLCQGLREEYAIGEPPLFSYGEHGKPEIVGHPDIHFNLSHCSEAAICVISNRPVGVDIESIRQYKESLARYTMNDREMQQILAAPEPDVAFIRLWTMKEAVLKCSRHGLVDDMKTVLTGRKQITTVVNRERGYVFSWVMA